MGEKKFVRISNCTNAHTKMFGDEGQIHGPYMLKSTIAAEHRGYNSLRSGANYSCFTSSPARNTGGDVPLVIYMSRDFNATGKQLLYVHQIMSIYF